MACINPNSPEFKSALQRTGNPLLAEIEVDKNQQQIKPGVAELFESNPELANAVYEALGYKPYFNWKKELKHYHKEVPHTFKPGLTKLPNGKYLVKAFRTDDSGLGSKGFGQRGKGLYLSITDAYPGNNVNIVEFEISPSEILTYKQDKYPDTIPYKNLKDNFKGTFDEAVLNAGGKAFIGGINGSEDSNLEIVLYDKNLIEKAIASKKPYSDFFTSGKPYSVLQKQQAQQLYQSFLDVYLQDFEQVESVLKEEKIIDKKCS